MGLSTRRRSSRRSNGRAERVARWAQYLCSGRPQATHEPIFAHALADQGQELRLLLSLFIDPAREPQQLFLLFTFDRDTEEESAGQFAAQSINSLMTTPIGAPVKVCLRTMSMSGVPRKDDLLLGDGYVHCRHRPQCAGEPVCRVIFIEQSAERAVTVAAIACTAFGTSDLSDATRTQDPQSLPTRHECR